MKKCERCGNEIPDHYVNLLCDTCYPLVAAENDRLKQLAEEDKKEMGEASAQPEAQKPANKEEAVKYDKNGVWDPNYVEREEAEDKPQWMANIAQFQHSGVLLYGPTRTMYEFIKNWCLGYIQEHPQFGDVAKPKFIWRPKIVDVGCGCGVGSNVLSQEADFVWGIDKNEMSVKFAKEAFSRHKNGIYYSSQVSFDHLDIMQDSREFLKFDIVVAIEVIEHIGNPRKFLDIIINKFDKKKDGYEKTKYFISTPNRNNKHLSQTTPKNKFHCREWTSAEFYFVLKEKFTTVKLMNSLGQPISEAEYLTTNHTPLLAMCEV